MKVAVIIPVKELNAYLEESVPKIIDEHPNQIIILPDSIPKNLPLYAKNKSVKIVATGAIGPAEKRDKGASLTNADILAFLDDDSYPKNGWLKEMLIPFKNKNVAAVGGPAITPVNESIRKKASGLVFSSSLGAGRYVYRYIPTKISFEVDDYPTVNLSVRRLVFNKVKGFNTKYYPGEDTKLCLDIHNLGLKIVYTPKAVVYHHRRDLFVPHLKQITNYALHRGLFVKKFPKTSFRLNYFIPSLFVLYLMCGGILSMVVPSIAKFYMLPIMLYVILVLLSTLQVVKEKRLLLYPLVALGIIATHIFYGVYFLIGLLKSDLAR